MMNTTNTLPDIGGIATYTHELASLFSQWGHRVAVITYPLRNCQSLVRSDYSRLPYAVVRFDSYDFSSLRPPRRIDHECTHLSRVVVTSIRKTIFYCRAYSRIGRMVRDTYRYVQACLATNVCKGQDTTLLWALTWSPEGVAAFLTARLLKIPYTLTAHGMELLISPAGPTGNLYRTILKGSSKIFAVSNHTASLIRSANIPTNNVWVIHNGVNLERFNSTPAVEKYKRALTETYGLRGKKILLTIGRLVARKGHEKMLRALVAVRHAHPNIKYLIVGQGPLEDRLKALVRELHLDDIVLFVGTATEQEKTALLQLCDVFIMVNRDIPHEGKLDTEGLGIAFLEAGACGKPVIGGKAGGVPEVIVHGRTGLLVDPEDVKAIISAVLELLDDPQRAQAMGRRAKERVVEEFQWSKLGEAYLEALNRLSSKKPHV